MGTLVRWRSRANLAFIFEASSQPSLDPDEILGPPFLHLRLNGPLNAPPQTNTLARLRETRFPSMTNLTNLKNSSSVESVPDQKLIGSTATHRHELMAT